MTSQKCATCKFYANSIKILCAVNPTHRHGTYCPEYESDTFDLMAKINLMDEISEYDRINNMIAKERLKNYTYDHTRQTWVLKPEVKRRSEPNRSGLIAGGMSITTTGYIDLTWDD